ncbi:asparagine synthase-related protein [Streptomyces sp. NPDC005474]|uniref:asparagine synthase-related protein n=1 Tax=Streptomyces sp. NPDC005474 TaxID=3154878 RepID=UPI00345366C8
MNINITTVNGEIHVAYHQQVCEKCILPESFPGISFRADGVCSYCDSEEERVDGSREALDEAVRSCLEGADRRDYDCLVLYSGGKDSSLALTVAQRDLGLRVLAFTLDNGYLSADTSENMRRVLDSLGVDHVRFRPPAGIMAPLYRVSMQLDFDANTTKYSTGGCGSCISMVLAAGLRFATAHSIPLLVGGWTPGQFTTSPLVSVAFLQDVIARHFGPLQAASSSLDEQLVAWHHTDSSDSPLGLLNPLYVSPYSEEETIRQLNSLGWAKPRDTDSCSTNCRLNALLILDHIKKYGFHPYAYELAHHVRLGGLSRAAALEKVSSIGVRPQTLDRVAVELGIPSVLPPTEHPLHIPA